MPNLTNLPGFLDLREPIWLVTLVVPLLLLWLYIAKRRRREQVTWCDPATEAATVTGPRNREIGRHAMALTMVLALVGLPWFAAQPVVDTETKTDQVMLIWVIDTSQSMTQDDVTNRAGQTVSRMEGVVEALKLTVESAPEGALRQLVTFSDRDNVETHGLTRQSDELLEQINQLAEVELTQSTATEAGLATATHNCLQSFDLIDKLDPDSDDRPRENGAPCLIFLLSDGQCDNQPSCTGETEAIAAAGRDQGMTVHTVSWGDPAGDRKTSYLPDPESMAAIAAAGGGQHLESNQTEQLVGLYEEAIGKVETETVERVLAPAATWAARGLIPLVALWFIRAALAPILVVTKRPKSR